MFNLEANAERLLQLSDEYYITSVKALIEKSLVGELNSSSMESKKPIYGKAIDNKIDRVTYLLSLADVYGLKKLRNECLECLSSTASFTKSQLAANVSFAQLSEANRLEVYERKLTMLEEKLKQKDERLKKLQDECLKLRFELKGSERIQNTQN